MGIQLGKLQKVDLRKAWKHEALDFTNWLAQEENLNLLSDEIGIDIQLIQTEASVGKFNVDILAEESNTGRKIIIENQLEVTNHDHLGKIITYASGYDAEIIIWIVERFRNEHKSAIDWLNEHTDDKLNFFGITVELWQIANSPIAPKFNIVSQPNSWSKAIKNSSKKGELSETALKQISFFEGFVSYCSTEGTSLRLGNPQPSTPSYYSFGIGISGVWVAIKINKSKKLIKLDLYFKEKELFKLIRRETEEQAKERFPNLIWDDMPKYKGASIGLIMKDFNIDDRESWEMDYKWLKDNSERLVEFFYEKITEVKNSLQQNSV